MLGTIETERLLLRPLTDADAPVMVERLSDFRISRNLARVPYPYHRSDADDFISWVAELDSRSAVRAIALREEPHSLLGIISYEYKAEKDDADLGYWLSLSAWGRGYGTEAARAMVDDAFRRAELALLVACYFNDNPVSGKLLRRVGFEEVGPCSAFSKAQGCEVPVTNMRLPRARWQSLRQAPA